MKKILHRVSAFALVCILLTILVMSVSAAELNTASDVMPIELENGPEAGMVLGTQATLLFTMRAANVTEFLSSKGSSKYFVPKNYSDKGICIEGCLKHSVTNGKIRAGVCYFDPNKEVYVPGFYEDTTSNQDFWQRLDAARLIQNKTYYGYIRNDQGAGAVNGGYLNVLHD